MWRHDAVFLLLEINVGNQVTSSLPKLFAV